MIDALFCFTRQLVFYFMSSIDILIAKIIKIFTFFENKNIST